MSASVPRPGAVTFVAIVLFLFGTIYLVGACSTGTLATYVALNPEPADPKAKIEFDDMVAMQQFLVRDVPGLLGIMFAVAVLDFLFGIAQSACGFGTLRLRPTARTATIVLILMRLLYVLGYDAFSAFVLMPSQIRFMELHPPKMPDNGAPPFDIFPILRGLLLVFIVAGMLVQIFVSSLIVFLLTRPSVKAAFADTLATAPAVEESPLSAYKGYEDEEMPA